MKSSPILFNSEIVRAILNGTKTQTRRVLTPPWKRSVLDGSPCWRFKNATVWDNGTWHTWDNEGVGGENWEELTVEKAKIEAAISAAIQGFWRCPFGQPGDRLWVRETFNGDPSRGIGYAYRATQPEMDGCPWIPSIHMPRAASRITLEIIGIRVERLNEISAADACKEGAAEILHRPTNDPVRRLAYDKFGETLSDDRYAGSIAAFAALWESINGPGSWEANPWCWVVEFKRVTP